MRSSGVFAYASRAPMMMLAQASKYFSTISAFTTDWSVVSSKNLSGTTIVSSQLTRARCRHWSSFEPPRRQRLTTVHQGAGRAPGHPGRAQGEFDGVVDVRGGTELMR